MSTTQEAAEMSSGVEAKGQTTSTTVERSVDWQTVFDEEEGDYIPRENLWKRLVINDHVDGKPEAEEAIQSAEDDGRITLTNNGYRLNSNVETQSDTPNAHAQSSQVHSTVQELRESADDKDEYISSMESALSTVLGRMDDLEERQDNVENRMDDVQEQDEDRGQRVNKIFTHYDEVRTGLTEIQLRRLEDGELLSADAVDVDALKEMGYKPIIVGDNRDAVRLPADEQDDGNSGNSRDLPDFNSLCKLEELRVKKKLKLMTREDIENDSAYKFRAMVVWDDAGLLDVSDNKNEISIPSSKVREKLMKIDDISRPSSYEIAKRTMEKMTPKTANEKDGDWSNGVFRFDGSGNENRIVADVDDFTAATVQRFSTSSVAGEGGDSNTVVR